MFARNLFPAALTAGLFFSCTPAASAAGALYGLGPASTTPEVEPALPVVPVKDVFAGDWNCERLAGGLERWSARASLASPAVLAQKIEYGKPVFEGKSASGLDPQVLAQGLFAAVTMTEVIVTAEALEAHPQAKFLIPAMRHLVENLHPEDLPDVLEGCVSKQQYAAGNLRHWAEVLGRVSASSAAAE